jgi:hypothetical protein
MLRTVTGKWASRSLMPRPVVPASPSMKMVFMRREVRMFFFEKKNQKTFVRLSRRRRRGPRQPLQKFFASFFPKKKAFLTSC